MGDHSELDAGDFGDWLVAIRASLSDRRDMDVPCGGCTACCRSHQFVHVDADETDTLAHIPEALLFPAPGGSPGSRVLGYDADGRCPMLVDDRCSIYEHRPRACRTYDCRVFAATGLRADQPLIDERVRRWRFTFANDAARQEHDALRARATPMRGAATEVAIRALSARDDV